jgi:predicted LPLAT superfamily acyltransferase
MNQGILNVSPCIVIPVFNHGREIAVTLARILTHGLPCIVVDDGSDLPTRRILEELRDRYSPDVILLRREANGGKGAAVMTGLRAARDAGYTHALQIDADGQHDTADVPRFLDAMRRAPDALILGQPVYDESVPASRHYGRYLTHAWVWIETLSFDIRDSMCGFRLYPLPAVCALIDAVKLGERMDFDIEVLVRLHWKGVNVVTIPTRVTYAADGLSHFHVWRDNLRISRMHTALFLGMRWRAPMLLARKLTARGTAQAWWRVAERGSALGMRILAWSARVFGVRFTSLLLHPVVAYFVLTSRVARVASAAYLSRLARTTPHASVPRPSWVSFYRHILSFARSGLDKLVAWRGRLAPDRFECATPELLDELASREQGALLLGSHLGSLEMVRAMASHRAVSRVTAVVYTQHAQRFNSMLRHANDAFRCGVLEITDIGPETAMLLKQRIDAGDLLVIVGDRVPVASQRTVGVRFLGETASFAQGPYVLAHLLACPVYLIFCPEEDGKYRLYLERFAERVNLPRRDREAAIAAHAQRFAGRLEHYCRKAPLQWFNFYDFWRRGEPGLLTKDQAHD